MSSILSVPNDVLSYTFSSPLSEGALSSLRLTNMQFKAITDNTLRLYWSRLERSLPQGPVNLPRLINKMEPTKYLDTNPGQIFAGLLKEFFNNGVTLPENKLPLTPADFEGLQFQAQIEQDTALLAIWPRIAEKLCTPPPQLNQAKEIRDWLSQQPEDALKISYPFSLDLSYLGLKVLPPEVAKLTLLLTLELNDNELRCLPDAIGALTNLKTLLLNNNKLRALPDTIGALRQLTYLELGNNQLSSLPDAIGDLEHLKILELSSNNFEAKPSVLESLTELQNLDSCKQF
jgi:Leucine-rich repeat (LRR) protein